MSLTKPKNGMFREFRGIKTIIDKVDVQMYREILPKPIEPHERPLISVFVADYVKVFPWPMTMYQEGCVSLLCRYGGEEYWYVYTMPVTKLVPMWGGRKMGFPKYIADMIVLRRDDGKWTGEVMHNNGRILSLSFSPGPDREPREPEKILLNEKRFFFEKTINLYPPSKGPGVIITELVHKVKENWNPDYGMIKVNADKGGPLDGLFDKTESYIGMYNEFTGGINLNPIKLC